MKRLFICAILLLSCKASVDCEVVAGEPRITYDDQTLTSTFTKSNMGNFSDSIVKYVSYIKLEYSPESVVRYISDIKFTDELMVISDFHNEKQVFLFKTNGEFIRKISQKGHAQNEYMNPSDVTIDEANKIIYVLDGDMGRLLSFDYDGHFIQCQLLSIKFVSNMSLVNDSTVLFSRGCGDNDNKSKESYDLVKYNLKQDKVTNQFYKHNHRQIKDFPAGECFSEFGTNIYYWGGLDTKVVKVENDSLIVRYEIDGDFVKSPSELKSTTTDEYLMKDYARISNYIEFKNWHFAKVDTPTSPIITFANKSTNMRYWDISHIKGGDVVIFPNIMKMNDDMACSWVNIKDIRKLKMFNKTFDSIGECGNPVIVVYYLR